jgi:ABC-2 type transport system ATP-binding protein
MAPLLELNNITKYYGDNAAVDDVTIVVRSDEVVGLIGPNGAGKTTIIKIALGLVRERKGSVRLLETDYHTDALRIKRGLGYVPEVVAPPERLRVGEYLQYIAALHDLPAEEARSAWQEFSGRLSFDVDSSAFIDTLSKGSRQKLVIVASVLHRPRLWVLDEPIGGLDPTSLNLLKQMIDEYSRDGRGVLISTHMLSFVESLCDRVYVLVEGGIVGEKQLESRGSRLPTSSPIETYYNEVTESRSQPL